MKSLLRFTVAALLSMVMFIGCATTGDANAETTEKSTSVAEKSDKSSGKKAPSKKASVGEYVGQYDETMTPENSCVIFFLAGSDLEEVFKQINPNLDVDEQKFTYGLFSMYRVSVFKPCKPGSRYMLTKLRGSAHYSFQDVNWDMEFKPNEQYLVIDVPNEPGIYCYSDPKMGWLGGEILARRISNGKAYELPAPDTGKYTKAVYKQAAKQFKKLYSGTPWYDAFLEKQKTIK